jgi:hypothetical protein
MATTQSISPLHSPQTRRRISAAQLAKYMAEDLRDLAAAEARMGFGPKKALVLVPKKAVRR